MKEKPMQILLRGYEKKDMENLIKYYEKKVQTKFTRADIIRIALNQLAERTIKKS